LVIVISFRFCAPDWRQTSRRLRGDASRSERKLTLAIDGPRLCSITDPASGLDHPDAADRGQSLSSIQKNQRKTVTSKWACTREIASSNAEPVT
jgi:hypothetical protein